MAESNIYHWKELPELNGKYVEVNTDFISTIDIIACDLSSILPFFDDDFLNDTFLNQYQSFTISNSAKNLIDSLLESYNIHNLNTSFYLLSAMLQKEYLYYYLQDHNMKPLIKEFQDERKDLKKLLDTLFINLSQDNGIIKSVSFKTKKSTFTLNNFFIVNDILEALNDYYGLTIENFEKRKQKLIDNTNDVKFSSLDEYHKWGLIKSLYNYISNDDTNTNSTLNKHIRFVGSFMHISQIPVNKTHFEVSITNDIKTIISTDEIKYLNGFLNRPKAFFVK